ncbi:MAG: hypothetical protein ACK53Y_22650, partial [bacterium]
IRQVGFNSVYNPCSKNRRTRGGFLSHGHTFELLVSKGTCRLNVMQLLNILVYLLETSAVFEPMNMRG